MSASFHVLYFTNKATLFLRLGYLHLEHGDAALRTAVRHAVLILHRDTSGVKKMFGFFRQG